DQRHGARSARRGRDSAGDRVAGPHVGRARHHPHRAAQTRAAYRRRAGRARHAGSARGLMPVTLDIRDHVARVTIDRPDVLNAIDAEAEAELQAIWTTLESDRAVRVVVLTGS